MQDINFTVFFAIWANHKGWQLPALHVQICDWLENRGRVAVLEVFRGAAKSTIVACYEAYVLWKNPQWRFLVQAADDDLAVSMSRDCREVLRQHPLCVGMLDNKTSEHTFWVRAANDMRNASVTAAGIMSNVVGSRADEVIFDDVEVPRNISSHALREKLRARMSDATYILVKGGKKLFIGTPHCHDSIYDEEEAKGADTLKIPLFRHNQRGEYAEPIQSIRLIDHERDLIVMRGADTLQAGFDYTVDGDVLTFTKPFTGLLDIYSGCAWPERFPPDEIASRRKQAYSLNEWDSQYMLRAKPLDEARLSPDLMDFYEVEPEFTEANGQLCCKLGNRMISLVRAYWDVASGKVKADSSVLSIVFQDEQGRMYWHAAEPLIGDIHQQCDAVKQLAKRYRLPAISVETNGIGGFVPAILRKALAGVDCRVVEVHATGNKGERILGAIETPLSAGLLWAHTRIADGYALTEMREFSPVDKDYSPDYLDSLAGAILATPVKMRYQRNTPESSAFRSSNGMHIAKHISRV